jgi:hypothetical protein
MAFLIKLEENQKVLIPCEILNPYKQTWFLFLFIFTFQILGCDKRPLRARTGGPVPTSAAVLRVRTTCLMVRLEKLATIFFISKITEPTEE